MRRLATPAALIALLLPAAADAHGTALTFARARVAIIREVGPGTTVGACRRLSAQRVRCAFSTPAINEGIETEDPTARFSSWQTTAIG
jgi:hypothetical protein